MGWVSHTIFCADMRRDLFLIIIGQLSFKSTYSKFSFSVIHQFLLKNSLQNKTHLNNRKFYPLTLHRVNNNNKDKATNFLNVSSTNSSIGKIYIEIISYCCCIMWFRSFLVKLHVSINICVVYSGKCCHNLSIKTFCRKSKQLVPVTVASKNMIQWLCYLVYQS